MNVAAIQNTPKCGEYHPAGKAGQPVRLISDFESVLANMKRHNPLARLTAEYLPPPGNPDREPCVRALVVALRFLPSPSRLRKEEIDALRRAICPRNELIIDELRAATNQPSGSPELLRYSLGCVLVARRDPGGIPRLGVIALLHRLYRLAECLK